MQTEAEREIDEIYEALENRETERTFTQKVNKWMGRITFMFIGWGLCISYMIFDYQRFVYFKRELWNQLFERVLK